MTDKRGGVFQWVYFEKQLCICVSQGMSTASQEEHTPVSHVLVLPFLPKILFLLELTVQTSRAEPGLCVGPFLKVTFLQTLTLFGKMDSSTLMTVHFLLAVL